MNSYQNNHEIVDVQENYGDDLNRYPYANDPNVAMRNTNYKDWMAGNEEIAPSSLALLSSSLGILVRMITVSGVLGKAPTIIGILVDSLRLITEGTGYNLLRHTEQLIQQMLATQYRQNATGAINGIARAYERYLNFFNQWYHNRTQQNGSQLETEFGLVNTLCMNALSSQASLSRRGFETILLPNYVLAANFHLLLLRDATLYRNEWTGNPNPNSNLDHADLVRFIREYSDHCRRWYDDGLNRMPRSNFQDWVRRNAYRRDMTVSVLDFLPIFPTYDPRVFPIGTNVQLTRVLHTDPITPIRGFSRGNPPTFTQMESLVNSSNRPQFLDGIDIFTSFYHQPHNADRDFWSGNDNLLNNGTRQFFGHRSDRRPWSNGVGHLDIYSVHMTTHDIDLPGASYAGINAATFYAVNRYNNSPNRLDYQVPVSNGFARRQEVVYFPGDGTLLPNRNNYTHRLFQITNMYRTNHNVRRAVFLHAWTHRSFRRGNGFKADQIMQIPAVKTISNSDDCVMTSYAGENMIKLNDLTTGLFYKVTAADSEAMHTRFNVRIRYASMNNNKLHLVLNGSEVASLNVKRTVQSGGSLTDLQYGNLKYATFAGDFKMGSQSILGIFKKIPNTEFVLDKIELIPICTFVNQSVEKTQGYNTYDQSYNNHDENMENTYQPSYDNYNPNSSDTYDQSYNNHDENMENTYQPSYNNYNPNSSDTYDQSYNNYDENMENTYQPSYNNYNPNSSDTYDQSYNNYDENMENMYQPSYDNYNPNCRCNCK
ncbi:hypothetical protein EXW59_01040 (plasmid) [Bacillus mycoides]|uniref:insecticidal delta-endotoxin Cry8Ea1 family protein n=1 Tax=Bacillus mycoides TaxID=1405 RepID=UPI001C026DA0|nr:insecticidal delta-endotoxin Cry8Ea1 family protein [Bacillus mycoides]QWH75484.1 hypothetical protein EXW59_01040 [Bacillus mycoides]